MGRFCVPNPSMRLCMVTHNHVVRALTRGPKPWNLADLLRGMFHAIPRPMHLATRPLQLFALLAATALAGACQPEKAGMTDPDSEGSSEGDTGSTTDGQVTTGDALGCTPGETKDGDCGNTCECSDAGTWACTDKGCAPLEEGFAASLTAKGGCDDVFMYAQNDAGTISVELGATGLVAAATENAKVTTTDFVLPDAAVQLVAKTGQNLHEGLCTDFSEIEPTVDLSYLPTAGTVSITITPAIDVGDSPTATAEFKDVIWKLMGDDNAPTVSRPALVIKDVTVGWLPG